MGFNPEPILLGPEHVDIAYSKPPRRPDIDVDPPLERFNQSSAWSRFRSEPSEGWDTGTTGKKWHYWKGPRPSCGSEAGLSSLACRNLAFFGHARLACKKCMKQMVDVTAYVLR